MGHVTDEEGPKSKRKGKKNGMKPGQALSFSGLEPRKWDGVDMLDMKQMIPRAIGGTFCAYSPTSCLRAHMPACAFSRAACVCACHARAHAFALARACTHSPVLLLTRMRVASHAASHTP